MSHLTMSTSPYCHVSISGTPYVHMAVTTPNPEMKLLETKHPLEIKKDDYDYDDCSDLEYFRKRFRDMNLDWPLTPNNEKLQLQNAKKDYPDLEDEDLVIIKAAYDVANTRQKAAMRTIAQNINLEL